MEGRIPLKLLVTIVDRGKGAAAVRLYRAHALRFEYLVMGLGTASSKTLDYFGLAETEKDVVLTLIPAPKAGQVVAQAGRAFGLSRPGHGIVFTVPLSGASRQIPMALCKPENLPPDRGEREGEKMESSIRYDLILAVVNQSYTDTVMDAARTQGARGGTVIHARRMGSDKREMLPGFALQPEKELVVILTPREQKHELMKAIHRAAGPATEAAGILFSLPVNDMMGLQAPVPEENL
ncbi:MAG: hypothetical protein LUE91_03980 [Oscillospiraceae bacterium]|nr:hypothetical protein [Oscillospiraceae bacterium]